MRNLPSILPSFLWGLFSQFGSFINFFISHINNKLHPLNTMKTIKLLATTILVSAAALILLHFLGLL